MTARRPNETSPLLQGDGGATANGRGPGAPRALDDSRSLSQLHRARYALIPLLLVAILGILWVFSFGEDPNSHAYRASHLRAPLVNSSAFSDAELLTLAPPFEVAGHPIAPKTLNRSAFAGRAIPTNAFWSNLLVGDDHGLNAGAGPVTLSPYTVRCLPKRVDVSYGDTRRVVTSGNITEYFNVDAAFTAYARKTNASSALLGDGNATHRELLAFDALSAAVQYRFDNVSREAYTAPTQFMNALLVRGAPYLTVEYANLLPVLEFNATVFAINSVPVQELAEPVAANARQQWTARRFEIDLGVYGAARGAVVRQKWVLYFASPRTLRLQLANEKDYRPYNLRGELTTPTNVRLVDSELYTGAARLAVVPMGDAQSPPAYNATSGGNSSLVALLDAHADVYPVATSLETKVIEGGATALVTLRWAPKTLAGKTPSTTDATPLLLLAHPHHVASFSETHQEDAAFRVASSLSSGAAYRTVKSFMTPVVGNTWVLEETLADVGFYGPATELDALRAQPTLVDAILTAVRNDSTYEPEAQDPYYFGKEIARQARLVLIADALGGENKTRETLLDNLEDWVGPWLVGSNSDQFVYDQDWGGLCSLNGLKGVFWMTDFGNGWYNDHHFHYGYFLYALAVVAKFRPEFAATHKAAILAITRDIASANPNDAYFPFTRHFSWFDGHSFASGVYLLDGGKSQESVSEAINAYYGVYLLGQALAIPQVEHMGRILMALESRAAQTYWQMPADTTIYEPIYAQNKMTGQIASTKVSYTTWFGPEIEHMHLINIIPFTPATEQFVTPAYVAEEYPVLDQQAFQRAVNPIDDRWRGYAFLDLAIIDPKKAWELVQQLDFFDDGSSRANSLFWIATRPNATAVLTAA